MNSVKSIKFLKEWRCFKENETVEFRTGINLLVGDQGTGKSSLIEILTRKQKNKDIEVEFTGKPSYRAFDFEKDLPRNKSHWVDDNSTEAMVFQINQKWKSHGECVNQMLSFLDGFEKNPPNILILDEPDAALSVRSCFKLLKTLENASKHVNQIICSVHNPIIIEAIPEVLSLEHRNWMKSEDFIQSQKQEISSEQTMCR